MHLIENPRRFFLALVVLAVTAAAAAGVTWVLVPREAPLGPHVVRALNARELQIGGDIAPGVATELRTLLAAHPQAAVLHLTSFGGDIDEARELYDLVVGHKLTTFVPSTCESACTIVFAGGEPRYLQEGAELGFHQSSATDVPYEEIAPFDAEDEQLFRDAGVRDDFVRKIHTTTNDDMWNPSTFELTESGLVTEVVDGFDYVDSDHVGAEPKKWESELLDDEVFQRLKAVDAAGFAFAARAYLDDTARGASRGEAVGRLHARVLGFRAAYAPWASDKALAGYAATSLAAWRAHLAPGDAQCLAFFHPETLAPGALDDIDDAAWDALLDNAAAVFDTYDPLRQIPASAPLGETDCAAHAKRLGDRGAALGEARRAALLRFLGR